MIKPLTSLRFFFAFIVFLSHLDFFPKEEVLFNEIYVGFLKHGSLGVSFFFILSGFILALNYKERIITGKVSFKEFWIARIARIYPLHLFTLFISLPIFLSDSFKNPFIWLISFLSNLFLLQSFVPDENFYFGFNAVSWSISNELFYYLAFPFIILLLYRYSRGIMLSILFLLLIPLGIYVSPTHIEVFTFGINPLLRISDFIIGILLFMVFEQKNFNRLFDKVFTATCIEIGAILIFIGFFTFRHYIPGGYRLSSYYWIPMTIIILVYAYNAGFISKILSNKFLVLLGEISFSFYMLHALLMRYSFAIDRRFQVIQNHYILVLLIFVVLIFVSYLVHKYLELPANLYLRKYGKNNSKQKDEIKKPTVLFEDKAENKF